MHEPKIIIHKSIKSSYVCQGKKYLHNFQGCDHIVDFFFTDAAFNNYDKSYSMHKVKVNVHFNEQNQGTFQSIK